MSKPSQVSSAGFVSETDKQAPRAVKAVLFDLGRVLIDFDHLRAAESLSCFTDKSAQEIFDLFFDSELTALFEEGKISPRGFFAEVGRMLSLDISYHQFVPIWNEIFFFSEKNLGVYQCARKIENTYKFAVLSNINILHLEYIKRTFPLLNAFTIIASNELGLRKPHLDIYRKALQKLGEPAESVFYADDRAELVASASELGMRSFIFKDVEVLKKDLRGAGVDIF
ncbi:MAG: HAD-IA family hydrolase [Candidatus Omnitrophota bacterium]